jgi:MerR family transcriptional regulator, repressor of the yfmOP operon
VSENAYRIGEVAERTGVTTRTIRYYEELGLLGTEAQREKGRHRLYCETDIARLEELIRLRDLLGISLDELKCLLVAEEAGTVERREILQQALRNVDAQLELVCARHEALKRLEDELATKRRTIRSRLRALRNRNTRD